MKNQRYFTLASVLLLLSGCALPRDNPPNAEKNTLRFDDVHTEFSAEEMDKFAKQNELGDWRAWTTLGASSFPYLPMPAEWERLAAKHPELVRKRPHYRITMGKLEGRNFEIIYGEDDHLLILIED